MVSKELTGVFRSLRIYHGERAPRAAMDALYSRFIAPDDIVFDIGAHVGDRVSSFRRLGARVIAVEPQPLLARALNLIHGRDPGVLVIPAAIAAEPGEYTLHVNSRNPTVSTISDAFLIDAEGAPGWENQAWDNAITVPALTLDLLIDRFGTPAFIKIDVEGYEDEVLRGLAQAVRALSFEFTTISRDVALRALDRVAALGAYRFDCALGETQSFVFGRWVMASEMRHYLSTLPHEANSGDVYALRDETG